jgi:hypothetical protein
MAEGGIRLEAMKCWLDEYGYKDPEERERRFDLWSRMDAYWRVLHSPSSKGKRKNITLPGGETGEEKEWQDETSISDFESTPEGRSEVPSTSSEASRKCVVKQTAPTER